jgi:cytochrome P450
MLPLLEEINSKLEYHIKASVQSKEDVELKDLMGRYSMSAIASCAFGVDSCSFTNEGSESEFVKQAKKMFQGDFWSKIIFTVTIFTPNRVKQIFSGIGLKNFPPVPNLKENTFFQNVVEATIKQRKESKKRRNDLVDLMIDATEGKLDSTEGESEKHNNNEMESNSMNPSSKKFEDLGYDSVISTAVIFLFAGYDTTGTTMSYILYELALNQDCQNALFEEIERNTNSTGELSYDAIQSLPYLEAVIHETLRKYPVLSMLERPCTKDYKLPNTDLVVEKGMRVRLNNVGICFDPEIYPKPEEWNPDNFSKENRANRNPYSFMAFSLGPRNCLAMRFAMFEMKVAISHVVSKFKILATPKTCKNVQVDPKHMLGAAKEGLLIKFEERK